MVVGLKWPSIYSPVNKNHYVKIQGTDRDLLEALDLQHQFEDWRLLIWDLLRSSYRRAICFTITPTDVTSMNWRLISHLNCSIQTYEHCKGPLAPPTTSCPQRKLLQHSDQKKARFFPHAIRMLNSEWRAPSLFLCIDNAVEKLQLMHIINHSHLLIFLF